MLKRIAKLAKQQGSFQLACKKYTQVTATASRHMLSALPWMPHTTLVGHVVRSHSIGARYGYYIVG